MKTRNPTDTFWPVVNTDTLIACSPSPSFHLDDQGLDLVEVPTRLSLSVSVSLAMTTISSGQLPFFSWIVPNHRSCCFAIGQFRIVLEGAQGLVFAWVIIVDIDPASDRQNRPPQR
jgi:hypothetical protein